MNKETKTDPLALFFDEDIYFPFEVTENQPVTPQPTKKASVKSGKSKTALKMASIFNRTPAEAERKFYDKVLQAIGRRIADTPEKEILRPSTEDLVGFAMENNSNALVVWGYTPEDFNLKGERYQILQQNQIQILFSHSLSELAADKGGKLKRQLWTVLREHYQS